MLSGFNMYVRGVPEIEETMEHKKVLEKILANISPNTKHKAMKAEQTQSQRENHQSRRRQMMHHIPENDGLSSSWLS